MYERLLGRIRGRDCFQTWRFDFSMLKIRRVDLEETDKRENYCLPKILRTLLIGGESSELAGDL